MEAARPVHQVFVQFIKFIASNDIEICSPVDKSISISRVDGLDVISFESFKRFSKIQHCTI